MKRLVWVLLALCLGAPLRAQERLVSQTLLVPPGPGFQWSYYLYLPESHSAHARLLVIPNNAGNLDTDPARAQREAYDKALHFHLLAEHLGCPLLVPTFARTDKFYATSLSRDTMLQTDGRLFRPDLQLLAMIDDARGRLSMRAWDVPSKILMWGFSADGMFSNRFSFLHPERVEAAAVGSPGGWPISPLPTWSEASLRYPIGTADLEALTGQPLDLAALRKVDFFFFLGDKDDNDSVPFTDGYTREDRDLVFRLFGKTPVERWPLAERIYRQAGLRCSFHLYPGLGHSTNDQANREILEFLRSHLGGQSEALEGAK